MKRFALAWQTTFLWLPLTACSLAVAQPPGRGQRDAGPRDAPPGERRFEGMRGDGPPIEAMLRAFPVFAALDADGDGIISQAELENATAALKQLDKDGDGRLTEDEIRPSFAGRGGPFGGPFAGPGRPSGPGGPGGPGGPRGFGPRDGGDGRGFGGPPDVRERRESERDRQAERSRLSIEQVTAALRELVLNADSNDDGYLTGEELIAMLRPATEQEQAAGERPGAERGDATRGPFGFGRGYCRCPPRW